MTEAHGGAPAPSPCASCPYRKDVPSGLWDRSEYEKLPAYDRETGEQPPAAFFCHQQDGRLCAGWCGNARHGREPRPPVRRPGVWLYPPPELDAVCVDHIDDDEWVKARIDQQDTPTPPPPPR